MVLERLVYKVRQLHPNIFAYIKDSGTANNPAEFLSIIDNRLVTAVFLDLEKAFELANPLAILRSLVREGANG